MFFSDVTVSNGFLIREEGLPSAASGLPPSAIDGAVWLVEPRRTTSVQKFSGTLVHPVRNDKLGITLSVFTHFVYEASHQDLVLADIQGLYYPSYHHCSNVSYTLFNFIHPGSPMVIGGCDTLVLFDLMTHSKSMYVFYNSNDVSNIKLTLPMKPGTQVLVTTEAKASIHSSINTPAITSVWHLAWHHCCQSNLSLLLTIGM